MNDKSKEGEDSEAGVRQAKRNIRDDVRSGWKLYQAVTGAWILFCVKCVCVGERCIERLKVYICILLFVFSLCMVFVFCMSVEKRV